MSRIKQASTFPRDWKSCSDQGHEVWTETYRGGLIMTVRRSSEQMLAYLDRSRALELRDYLVEAFPLEDQVRESGVIRSSAH